MPDNAPVLTLTDGLMTVVHGGLRATVAPDRVAVAHLGGRSLGSSRIAELPEGLVAAMDRKYGRSVWRNKKDWMARVGRAVAAAVERAGLESAVLVDTMRKGSDYYRPGNLLSRMADASREVGVDVVFQRDDALCPPADLLAAFIAPGSTMTFEGYANGYRDALSGSDAVDRAAAEAVVANARGRLPIYFCSDPWIPDGPFRAECRTLCCHRVVLAEVVSRALAGAGASPTLYEIHPTLPEIMVRPTPPSE